MQPFTFLNTGGAPISSHPLVSVFSGILEPQMWRKCTQPVDNAWLPFDPRVKLLSGLQSPAAPVEGMESCQPTRALHLVQGCAQHPSLMPCVMGDCVSRHWAVDQLCFHSCQPNLISFSTFLGKQMCCLLLGPPNPSYFNWCLLKHIIIYFPYYAVATRVFTVCCIIGKRVVYQANTMRLVSQSQQLWASSAIRKGRGRKRCMQLWCDPDGTKEGQVFALMSYSSVSMILSGTVLSAWEQSACSSQSITTRGFLLAVRCGGWALSCLGSICILSCTLSLQMGNGLNGLPWVMPEVNTEPRDDLGLFMSCTDPLATPSPPPCPVQHLFPSSNTRWKTEVTTSYT